MQTRRIIDVCRREAKDALIAAGIGVVIAALFTIGMPSSTKRFGLTVFHGAFTGLAIWAAISLLHLFLGPKIESISRKSLRTAAHMIVFAVGGVAGWLAGMAIALRNFRTILDARWLGFMGITVAVVIAVGFLFKTLDTLQARLREREWAEKELEIARSIQERLLPPNELEGSGYAIAARNLPARIVAGDFYDFVRIDDGSLAIVVADVAGKGVGASLIMASVKAVLPFITNNDVSTAMSLLNEKLLRELGRREFVALTLARFFPADGRLELANAGLPDPYHVRDGRAHPLVVAGERLPLGIRSGARYESMVTQIGRGERVLFISDGIAEAETTPGEPFGYDRLRTLVATNQAARPAAWLDQIIAGVQRQVSRALTDDWTAVVLQRE